MTETASPEAQRLAYIVTGDASNPSSRVSFVLNSRWRSYALGSDQGQKIVELLRATPQDIDTIAELADIPTWIAKQTHGRVTVDELERLRLDGKLIDYGLTGRITKIVEQGASFAALANFIENVSENPSPSVAEDLYRFLEKGNIPITPEGMILCFKRVDTDYRSFYAGHEDVTIRYPDGRTEVVKGRIPHPVGGEIEMDRDLCDPLRARVCSVGIHACSFEYLKLYHRGSGQIVIANIHPRDVTAIPSDANDTKLRCCRLQIVGEISEDEAREHFKDAVDKRYPAAAPAETEAAEDDVLELTEVVDESAADDLTDRLYDEGVRLRLLPIDEAADDLAPVNLDPGHWSAQGYANGREAGEEDRTNGYDYKPEFDIPIEIVEEEAARAAYSKAFVEAYDTAYRTTPVADEVAVEPPEVEEETD